MAESLSPKGLPDSEQLELPFDPPLPPKRELNPMTGEERAKVLDRFAFHPATEKTGPLHDQIRALHRAIAGEILALVPPGRHQACALTALQESMMWCNAAIACDTPKS